MKPTLSTEAIERELEALAPLVQRGFSGADGPSAHVLQAIHAEAVAQAAARRRRRFAVSLFRPLAAAAVLALLLGGVFQIHLAKLNGDNTRAMGHLLSLGSTHLSADTLTPSTSAGLANRLLLIQGLDEEAFFVTQDESEVL